MTANRPAIAVGAIVLVDSELLLIRRGRGAAQGFWSVPGGHVEFGESLSEAVEREVWEETRTRVACGRFVGWVERMTDGHHYVIMDFMASLTSPRSEPVAGDDANEARWVPVTELDGYELVSGLREFLDQHRVLV